MSGLPLGLVKLEVLLAVVQGVEETDGVRALGAWLASSTLSGLDGLYDSRRSLNSGAAAWCWDPRGSKAAYVTNLSTCAGLCLTYGGLLFS